MLNYKENSSVSNSYIYFERKNKEITEEMKNIIKFKKMKYFFDWGAKTSQSRTYLNKKHKIVVKIVSLS